MKILFVVMLVFYTASEALAVVALHLVVSRSPDTNHYPIYVTASDSRPGSVDVFIPVDETSGQIPIPAGYFLVTATKRQPADGLNFRGPMFLWGFTENAPEAVRLFFRWRFWREVGRIELIERLDAHESDAGTGIFINLETETALRSYIVFDHGPWGGAVVMDGGFWITFDLPSFVDEFAEALNACPWHARMLGRCRSPHL